MIKATLNANKLKFLNLNCFFSTLVANKDSLWYCEKFL